MAQAGASSGVISYEAFMFEDFLPR